MDIEKLKNLAAPFYAVIAKDVSHSLSPFLHALINKQTGSDIPYYALSVQEEELGGTLAALKKYGKGINVTIPYKSAVIPYLDTLSEQAAAIGAVNTIAKKGDRLYGCNTDIQGFIDTLAYYNVRAEGKKALVLGGGGVSKAIAYALLSLGASVEIASRSKDTPLPQALSKVKLAGYDEIDYDAEILVNGTPVGMRRIAQSSLVSLKDFPKMRFVFDSVYTPFYTPLLLEAESAGLACANGLYMLISQGIASRVIWGDAPPSDLSAIYRAMQTRLLSNEVKSAGNPIVLGGFMGVGKSYLGKELARHLSYRFVDLDTEIEKKHGPISDIFARKGEAEFRRIEKEELFALDFNEAVVSLGGGVLASSQLAQWLRQKACVINIARPFADIEANIGKDTLRPLAGNRENLYRLYTQRKDLYITNSHATFNATMDETENIIGLLKIAVYGKA
ncbi:MAG: shikimate kinase [Christensenellales bacterium]|jgi:shikimate dehydrogenase